MKKYIIGAIIVLILAFSSILYKYTQSCYSLSIKYPMPLIKENLNEYKIFLYVFFSKNNCQDCLGIIEVLNNLDSNNFVINGVVPEKEFNDMNEIRAITGAAFPIESNKRFKGLIPVYTPSIIGQSKEGHLLFILPGAPGGEEYLEEFLISFYNKLSTQREL